MSRKNTPSATLLSLCVAASIAILATATADPILSFYWTRAHSVFAAADPVSAGAHYSFVTRTYDKRFHDRGEFVLNDSVVVRYFFSFGALDSSQTIAGNLRKFPTVDLSIPDLFDSSYVLNSCPNDTGGPLLPIGFDTDMPNDPRPVGLAELDRSRYIPRWLYLYYPSKSGYRRYTRSFRFIEHQGLLFADSIWEVSTRDGLLFTTNRRLETGITDITVYH